MFLFIVFWLSFAVWLVNGFKPFLPAWLSHLLLGICVGILGYAAFGNPTDK